MVKPMFSYRVNGQPLGYWFAGVFLKYWFIGSGDVKSPRLVGCVNRQATEKWEFLMQSNLVEWVAG